MTLKGYYRNDEDVHFRFKLGLKLRRGNMQRKWETPRKYMYANYVIEEVGLKGCPGGAIWDQKHTFLIWKWYPWWLVEDCSNLKSPLSVVICTMWSMMRQNFAALAQFDPVDWHVCTVYMVYVIVGQHRRDLWTKSFYFPVRDTILVIRKVSIWGFRRLRICK